MTVILVIVIAHMFNPPPSDPPVSPSSNRSLLLCVFSLPEDRAREWNRSKMFGRSRGLSLSYRASPLFQPSHNGSVKAVPNMGWKKKGAGGGKKKQNSTNNIQMVPRLCSQLCLKEWQVQANHVEFFTLCHCLPTLTPSWAFSAPPEFCQASLGRSPARTAGLAPSKSHAESDSSLYFRKTKRRLDVLHQVSDEKHRKAPEEGHYSKSWSQIWPREEAVPSRIPRRDFAPPRPPWLLIGAQ